MIKVGEHITLDIIGTDKEYDPSVYEKVINKIAKAFAILLITFSYTEGSYSLSVPIMSKVMCSPTFIIKIIHFYNF